MAGTTSGGGAMNGTGTAAVLASDARAAADVCIAIVLAGVDAFSRKQAFSAVAGDVDRLEQVLLGREYAESTSRKYALIVFHFLDATGGRPDHADVKAYLEKLTLEGKSNAVVRVTLCAVRAVFDRILGWEITRGIAHVPPPAPRPVATQAQVNELFAARPNPTTDHLLQALYDHGLMPHQVRRLGRRDDGVSAGDDEPESVLIRIRPEADGAAAPAERVLRFEVRPKEYSGTDWLFASPCREEPLSTRTLQRRIAALATQCGLEVTCTAIRRAGHVEVLSAG